jgi:uncharacterized protein (DUF1501 family)
MDHCRDFAKSQMAAKAGQGLPQIEPGMPAPAGTGLSRRSFIFKSAGLAAAVYGASKLPMQMLEEGIAKAASQNNRVLVSIFFNGGIDSLSLLAPTGHQRYYDLRPSLALPRDQGTPLDQDPALSWHPAADGLAELYKEGKVTVFPAIGYNDPNQSHFTSRHFWETGQTQIGSKTGWLGRYLDRYGVIDNPLQGLSLEHTLYPSLATGTNPVSAVGRASSYNFLAPGVRGVVSERMQEAFASFGNDPAAVQSIQQARQTIKNMHLLNQQLRSYQAAESPVQYPGSTLAGKLKSLAAMIAAGLPLNCVTLNATGSYDTHINQITSFPNNLEQTSQAVLAFQRDLEARGLQDRVLTEMWSEFGRRPKENLTGTDHGAAGCAFLVGAKAKKAIVGEFTGLDTLDSRNNLRHSTDFRSFYASLLEQWLNADAAAIIPGADKMPRYNLLK